MFKRLLRASIERSARCFKYVSLYAVLSALCVATLPAPAAPVEPELLHTGIVPTMGLGDVSEGTLLFKTNQRGRFTPAPVLKTDVQMAVTGIIARNNTVRSLFPSLEPVTASSIRKAIRYTETLSADGGTEIVSAVRQALKSPQDKARLQQIVLLTDGQVGNEEELFEMVHLRLGTRRLFTIGIGPTPNSHLMRKTAEIGRGTFTYIGNVTEVKDNLDLLFRKLERPVLNDIAFDSSWPAVEQYPLQIADLYEGEPIVVAVKAGALPQQATLKGFAANQPWSMPVSFNGASSRGGLSVYWAREKISALMNETYQGGVEEAKRKAVLDVALAHHLVSKYTSLVAVDVTPARPTNTATEPEQPASAKMDESISINELAKGATSGQLQLLMGLATLTLAWLVWGFWKRVA
jgi:Ca-activated chloride channel homolog